MLQDIWYKTSAFEKSLIYLNKISNQYHEKFSGIKAELLSKSNLSQFYKAFIKQKQKFLKKLIEYFQPQIDADLSI